MLKVSPTTVTFTFFICASNNQQTYSFAYCTFVAFMIMPPLSMTVNHHLSVHLFGQDQTFVL